MCIFNLESISSHSQVKEWVEEKEEDIKESDVPGNNVVSTI